MHPAGGKSQGLMDIGGITKNPYTLDNDGEGDSYDQPDFGMGSEHSNGSHKAKNRLSVNINTDPNETE